MYRLATGVLVLAGLILWSYLAVSGTKNIVSVLRIGLGGIDPRTIVRTPRNLALSAFFRTRW